jgi:hypothetical protein
MIGYINIRIKTKLYADVEEVCCDIERLMELTKYNLKRISNDVNPETLIYACSCISRKQTRDNDNTSEYSEMVRKVKRKNDKACDFRIKYKLRDIGGYMLLDQYNFNHNHEPSKVK